jgi:hypothetical protein
MNSQKITLVIIAILSASLALAEDFKTVSGRVYKDATISRVEADGIVLRTKAGISKVYSLNFKIRSGTADPDLGADALDSYRWPCTFAR